MYKRALSNLERTLFSPERALKLRSTLSKVRSALRAHSERIQSGYIPALYTPALYPSALRADIERVRTRCIHGACERRGETQALPRAGSARSKVQSALRADIQSGYRADTERIQSGYRAMVSGGGIQALPQA